jgi:hypothetical protein
MNVDTDHKRRKGQPRQPAADGLAAAVAVFLLVCCLALRVHADVDVPFGISDHPALRIEYEGPMENAAAGMVPIYRTVRDELERRFNRAIDFRPTVVLIRTPILFRNQAGHPLIVAYALPTEFKIVMDYTRLAGRSRRLKSVLKHEMVHLVVHHGSVGWLPRWLEEGLAQWISDGFTELLESPRPALLEQAAAGGRLLPLAALADRFPTAYADLLLAYEESRSVVAFMVAQFGEKRLFWILEDLRSGRGLEETFERRLSLNVAELEARWLATFRKPTAWMAVLAAYLYEGLFLLGALLTVAGFVRFRLRKRRYRDEEDEADAAKP